MNAPSSPKKPSFAERYLRILILLLLAALVARGWTFYTLSDTQGNGGYGPLARGVLSDVASCAALALLVASMPRPLRFILLALWCFLLAGNREFLLVNDTNLRLDFIAEGEQGTFMRGSVFVPSVAIAFGMLALLTALAAVSVKRLRLRGARWWMRGILPASVAVAVLTPLSTVHLVWIQQNLVEENFRMMATRLLLTPTHESAEVKEQVRRMFFTHDLSGKQTVPPPQDRPNILIVIVESLSEWHIEQGMMPFLSRFRQEALYFPNFISQNRRTHTGLHIMLCGEYPNLVQRKSKAELFAAGRSVPAKRPCLPSLLKREGYHALFMQAANLSFMRKDAMAQRMGYEEWIGNADYAYGHHYTNWGVDDESLMQHAMERIRGLAQKDKPWFVTVLTAGTHHPFNIPPPQRRTRDRGYANAYLAADRSLEYLVSELRKDGLLDNTLLIITTDESNAKLAGDEVPAGQMSGNHGILIVHTPDKAVRANSNYFAQSDLTLSMLDYLGLPSDRYVGRSIFREYDAPRPIPFANVYLNRFYLFDGKDSLLMCDQNTMDCSGYRTSEAGLFTGPYKPIPKSPMDIVQAQALIALNDTKISARARPRVTQSHLQPQKKTRMQPQQAEVAIVFSGRAKKPQGYATSETIFRRRDIPVVVGETLVWKGKFSVQGPRQSKALLSFTVYEEGSDTPLIKKQQVLKSGRQKPVRFSFRPEQSMNLSLSVTMTADPDVSATLMHHRVTQRKSSDGAKKSDALEQAKAQ